MAKRFCRNKKAKGTTAENELVHQFWDNKWVCIRVAGSGSTQYPAPDILASGSGSTQYPAPDILASRGDKKIVMEVKVVNDVKKYFTGQEIRDLNYFGEKFGAESWVGVKFQQNQWYFCPTTELEETKAENYKIDLITMKRQGFKFDEMIK